MKKLVHKVLLSTLKFFSLRLWQVNNAAIVFMLRFISKISKMVAFAIYLFLWAQKNIFFVRPDKKLFTQKK